jgi:hypothetical protein
LSPLCLPARLLLLRLLTRRSHHRPTLFRTEGQHFSLFLHAMLSDYDDLLLTVLFMILSLLDDFTPNVLASEFDRYLILIL